MKRKQIMFILLILSVAVFFTYLPHIQYKFPIHVDEWNAIHDANQLEQGEYPGGLTALRFGFHLFLAILPFNLVSYYHILPALVTALSALLLFFIYRRELGENQSFVLAIFFILIKSTVATLGHWFFTPLSFSIPFLFLLHYAYKKYLIHQSRKNVTLIALTSFTLFFTYPIALIFYFTTQFFTFEWKEVFQRKKHISILTSRILFLLASGLALFSVILKQNPITIIVTKALIPIDWFGIAVTESPLEVMTWFGFIASIVGLFYVLKDKKIAKKVSSELSWLVIGLVWISISYITKFSIFVPLERVIFFTVLITPFFASHIYKIVENLFLKITSLRIKKMAALALILITIILFPLVLSDFELKEPGNELYYSIQEEEYEFIQALNITSNQTILAPLFTSLAIKVITDAEVVLHPPFIRDMDLLNQVSIFYQIPCDRDKEISNIIYEQVKYTHIYSRKNLSCLNDILVLVENKDDMYFYSAQVDK